MGRRVRSASLGSLRCALGVVGYVRGRWVHRVALWVSSGSFGVAGFIRVRPGEVGFFRGRSVYWSAPWGSSGLFGVSGYIGKRVGFVRSRWVHCGAPFVVVGFGQGHWIHWGDPWVRSGSFGSLEHALKAHPNELNDPKRTK